MSRYAEQTEVSVGRSRDEIDRTLVRFGATSQAWLRDDERHLVVVAFKRQGRAYRLTVPLPDPHDEKIRLTPSRKWDRSKEEIAKALEQETRRRFRSLANFLKAMLDAIDTGIISDNEALLPYLVLPSGETMAQHLEAQIVRMLESGHVPNIVRALAPGP